MDRIAYNETMLLLAVREQYNRLTLINEDNISPMLVTERKQLKSLLDNSENWKHTRGQLFDYAEIIEQSKLGANRSYEFNNPYDKRDHARQVNQTMQFIALYDKFIGVYDHA